MAETSDTTMYWDKSLRASNDPHWLDSGLFGEIPGLSFGRSRGDQGLGGSQRLAEHTVFQQADADFMYWEEANRKREVDILKRLVSDIEVSAQQRSQVLYEKQEQRDWEQKHDLWMKELVGNRNLGCTSLVEEPVGNMLLLDTSIDRAPVIGTARTFQTSSNGNMSHRSADPEAVRYHLEIVKCHKSTETFAAAARDLAKRVDNSGVHTPNFSAYATSLRLVSLILSRKSFSPVEIALATLTHFSHQFDAWITERIHQAALDGKSVPGLPSPIFKNPKANTVASFVSIEFGASAEMSLWPCLYYCLRIGDAMAAKEVFENTSTSNESDDTRSAIARIVESLCQRQGDAQSLWDGSGSFNLNADDTRAIADAREGMEAADDRLEVFRIGFVTLLGGSGNFPSSNLTGFSTVEDYLYGLLCNALNHSSPGGQLDNLGNKILHFGANYFDKNRDSGGWAYALPLFASQQFHTAFTYLEQFGGPTGRMQATHLGLFLGSSLNSELESLVSTLIVDYAMYVETNHGAVAALEYLRHIPNKQVMRRELVALIVRTQDVSLLAGSFTLEGTRSKGAFDDYFSYDEVSMLLKQAAENCRHDATDLDRLLRAGNLFLLSGQFRLLIEMLCNLMLNDPEIQGEQQQFFYQQLRAFYSSFLSRRTHVVDALERSGDSQIRAVCHDMMEIFDYFARINAGAYRQAWSTLDRLGIVPQTQPDITAQRELYKGMDPLLKKQIPTILLFALRSLQHEHSRLKDELQPGLETATRGVLKDLKEKGRVLLTFAGLISDAHDRIAEMTRLEGSMI